MTNYCPMNNTTVDVKYKIRSKNVNGIWKLARHSSGEIREFEKRQQARQFCRNNCLYWDAQISRPDGTWEDFKWNFYDGS